jgi:hypothetical protein
MRRFAWLLPVTLSTACGPQDSCFVKGTRIRCPEGDRPIEDLAIGDAIVAFDVRDLTCVVGKVAAIHRAMVREVRSIVAGSIVVRGVTRSHPFFEVSRGAFVEAETLRVGDPLLSADGPATITSIFAHELAEPSIEVFNLTVADAPPTFVADCVVVHNKSAPVDCTPYQAAILRIEAALPSPCAGDRFPIRAMRGPPWCSTGPVAATFATSDPKLLSVEGPGFDPATAIAHAPGLVTITALHDGLKTSIQITIRACDGGA